MTGSSTRTFTCNICGTKCPRPEGPFTREAATCPVCNSNVRIRSLAALLSREFFGTELPLPQIPVTKRLRGLGMSDGLELAARLEEKFDYKNTYYHREPRFDVTERDPSDKGRYDFIISSEVMEHIPPPVEKGFENLCWLLRPGGVLILTVPYGLQGQTLEHFPTLHQFTLASPGGRTVLLNRRMDGTVEMFENLVFHGGAGSTLETRIFSEDALRSLMIGAGFPCVRVASENVPEFGVEHGENWSLPIVARKGEARENNPELAEAYSRVCQELEELRKNSDMAIRDYQGELEARTNWALELEKELGERTEWALSLQKDLKEYQRLQAIWEKRSVMFRLRKMLGK